MYDRTLTYLLDTNAYILSFPEAPLQNMSSASN